MQICDSWLRDWVDHGLRPQDLADRLTMLGFEVESVSPVGAPVERLVVGRVLEVRPHPDAAKLQLCRVDIAGGEPLAIVCGASNVRAGGLYPVALDGARLPGGMSIRPTRIRGEPSAGMLCSAAELGLDGEEGLLELDQSAVPGSDASRLLELGDSVLDLNVTPNRADCFCVAGIAREVAAPAAVSVRERSIAPISPVIRDTFPVTLATDGCTRFAGRIVRGLEPGARTPLWLRERLRRCGIRPVHPVVDVTNYVMLELGQPMHAYDLGALRKGIVVRWARAGESVILLDGQEVRPGASALVIADDSGPVGLAGIMGGAPTAVTAATTDIFLESAWFAPSAIAGRARRFALHTDASLRFERGVDPSLQATAIERASGLILEIAGGRPGPVADIVAPEQPPRGATIVLRRSRLARLLGTAVPDADVARILSRLRMTVEAREDGWTVRPPSARFDVEREEDLIEEVARVFGYERIAPVAGQTALHLGGEGEMPNAEAAVTMLLVARGYQEAITYSFIDANLDRMFGAEATSQLMLTNPISADMAVMRQSLWPGLVRAAQANLNRQQARVKLFEIGPRFIGGPDGGHRETTCIAGIAVGGRLPEQWGVPATPVDFFDIKADVEALAAIGAGAGRVRFEAGDHPALHPGRSVRILEGSQAVGWLGELHPAVARDLDMPSAVVFEIEARVATDKAKGTYRRASKFPSVRRDLAVVVPQEVSADALLEVIHKAAPATLRDSFVFDIYTGPQVGAADKSVAIGLILQDTSRTLTDEDAEGILQSVKAALGRAFQARIRE
jgi:phenylalanyl-tRNA synthetase beta chain